ncbi:hypothetical protein ACHWQZ_G002878 [Mnemiopsis leidyi]
MYKCHNSEEMYNFDLFHYSLDGQLCSNDTQFYQACKRTRWEDINKNGLLCGKYFCSRYSDGTLMNEMIAAVADSERHCNGIQDCLNTEIDETFCPSPTNMTTLPSGMRVPTVEICNNKCYNIECEDEAICNGFTYGIYCQGSASDINRLPIYVRPYNICDKIPHCYNGEDEKDCAVTEETLHICKREINPIDPHPPLRIDVPIHNFTRCYSQMEGSGGIMIFNYHRYCMPPYFIDQTNCTDPDKIGLTCKYNDYTTSWAKQMVCPSFNDHHISLCYNGIDENCRNTSASCHLHKHYICDGERDCEDGSDENNPICQNMTEGKCRRYTKLRLELPLPLSWLQDGEEDCVDGRDEEGDWPTCGIGQSLRSVSNNDMCQNVYLCRYERSQHILLGELCDGIETCGGEIDVCSAGHTSSKLFTRAHTTDLSWNKHLSFCLKGLNDTNNFFKCDTIHSFIFPDHDYFGVDNRTTITLPADPKSCDHMFGETYVYTSCSSKCTNSSCPLRNIPRYEVCPSQFPDRIGTVAKFQDHEYLAFFTKTFRNSYTNRYFVCDNNITCIEYSKVCDLAADCEDGSDEEVCTNHFKCNSTGRFIPKTEMCDNSFDCFDLSDECNEQCPNHRHFLQSQLVNGFAWLIGSLAALANLVIICRSTFSLKNCRTAAALLNKTLIIAISLGDFLIGCYLLTVATYFRTLHQDNYCNKQITWITSRELV